MLENFPKHLPDHPGERKSYLGTLIRNKKFRISVCLTAFLAMAGGTVAAALCIGKGVQQINEGQAAISALYASPIITRHRRQCSIAAQTMIVTQTSVMTGQIMIPISQLQSNIYTIATAPSAPAIT